MPAPEVAYREQTAVLWPERGFDDDGHVKVGSPVEIQVRWNTGRTMALDPQGNKIAVDATMVVNRKLGVGSVLFKGALADWVGTGSGSAGDGDELMQVATFSEVPDLKGRFTRRVAGLVWFRDTLPELA